MAADVKTTVEISAIDNATRVFNQVSAGAKALEKSYLSLQSTFGAVVAGISLDKLVDQTAAWEQASTRLNAVLRATGNAAGLTRQQLDQMAASLSQSTPFDETDIRNAEANLLKFGNIHDQVFRDALKLSADFAAFSGGDVTSASQALGRALADPVNGLKGLQREFGNLTFSQKEYIAGLEAQGKTELAQAAILDIVRAKIGGAASDSNSGIVGLLGVFKKAWDEVGEAADLAFKKMQKLPSMTGGMFPEFVGPPEPAKAPTFEEAMAQQEAEQAAMVAKAQEAIDRQREAHTKAIPVLKSWGAQLTETTKQETALQLVLEGEARTWNDLDKAKLLNIAATLDQRKAQQTIIDAEGHGIAIAQQAGAQADAIQESYLRGARDRQESLELEISLIGKTTQEQEQLNALHEIELRQREALRQLAATDLDPEELARRSQTIMDASARETKAVLDGLQRRRDAERSWLTGTKTAFNDYIEHATNAAEQASMLFTDAFKSMEDALVQFALTGKLDFKAFADSVIADIARILARQAIAAGAGAVGFAFPGSLFGARAGGGASTGAGEDFGLTGSEFHAGGLVGRDGRPRFVHPAYFESAPRYHLGIDEVPAILQVGERVIPKGGSAGHVFNQRFVVGGNITKEDLVATAEAAKRGTLAALAEEKKRNPNGVFGR